MNKKISLGVAISLVAIGCAITFVLTWTISLNIYNGKLASTDKYEGLYAKLREMDVTVRNNYIGSVNDAAVDNSIINGYVLGVGDKYAAYLDAAAYYDLQQTEAGIISGVGFVAEEDGSGYLLVTHVYKGGSAELGGLVVGDVITEIDGKSLLTMENGTRVERLSGELGTKVTLKLLRNGEEATIVVLRQQIDIESVTYEMLSGNVGYIAISAFNAKTPEQFGNALTNLTDEGAAALIIDVRHNNGGVISALKPMLNRFIPATVVAEAEYSDGSRKTLIETDSEVSLTLPVAVLVDGGTAAAAEIFAAALKDECNAVLVGLQTGGKSLLQTTYELSDGSALSISTAKVFCSKTGDFGGSGIKPDYIVELPGGVTPDQVDSDSDSQLQKALELIRSQEEE